MRTLLSLLAILMALSAGASEPSDSLRLYWDVDFATIFDNREGDARYVNAKTFFQTRLAPEIGATFASPGARHRVAAGVVYTQPIGCEWEGHRLSPTIYYSYSNLRGISASLGMFSRDRLIRPLPNYLWSDSVYYSQRNIRGALLQYQSRAGFIEAALDWRGMQTRSQREAFNIIVQGEWKHRRLVAGGLGMMNHLARSGVSIDTEHVVDNFMLNPYFGLDWRGCDNPVTGYLHLGLLASMTRDRGDSSWLTRAGMWLEGGLTWYWLEARNTLYAGGRLFPIYSRYGVLLDQGEPFYASPWYDRLSIAAHLIDTRRVALRASLDFNFAKSNFTFYQRLILAVTIGSEPRRPRLLPL